MTPQTLSNYKYQWLKKVEAAEEKILRMVSHSIRGDLSKSTLQFRRLNQDLIKLGKRGEQIAEWAVSMHKNDDFIIDIRDAVNVLEILTEQIQKLAEGKFQGAVLPEFPVFRTNLPAANELMSQSRAVEALVKLTEGGDA